MRLLAGLLMAAALLASGVAVGSACEHSSTRIRIVVKGGVFHPASVEVPEGVPVTLVFRLEGSPGCVDQVVFPELGIPPVTLRQGRDVERALRPLGRGSYTFACPMDMVRGQLVVR